MTLIGVGITGTLIYLNLKNHMNWFDVFVGCHSDTIGLPSNILKSYAQDHNGYLPSFDMITTLMKNDALTKDKKLGQCYSGVPFMYNRLMEKININSDADHILMWCPVGSHKRYVAAFFLCKMGTFERRVLSIEELAVALQRELAYVKQD